MNCVCISKGKNKGGRNHNCFCAETLYANFQPKAIFLLLNYKLLEVGIYKGAANRPLTTATRRHDNEAGL